MALYEIVLLFSLVLRVLSEDFTGEECPLLLTLNRSIRNLGFHRNVDYSFELLSYEELKECKVCFKQTIPRGLFVNKDQIWELVRLGKLVAHVDGSVDVETPADKSVPHDVFVIAELSSNLNVYNATVALPVHARYHTAKKDGGFEQAAFPLPEVFLTCEQMPSQCKSSAQDGHLLCSAATDSRSYVPIKYSMNGESTSEINVPVGNSSHYEIVQIFTFIVTWAGSHFIYYTILNNKPRDGAS